MNASNQTRSLDLQLWISCKFLFRSYFPLIQSKEDENFKSFQQKIESLGPEFSYLLIKFYLISAIFGTEEKFFLNTNISILWKFLMIWTRFMPSIKTFSLVENHYHPLFYSVPARCVITGGHIWIMSTCLYPPCSGVCKM